MRKDLQIDDDVYAAAEQRAAAENRSVGEVLSDLARQALARERAEDGGGFPVFSVAAGSPKITLEMVQTALSEP